MSDKVLGELSRTAGVDLIALKEKYSSLSKQQGSKTSAETKKAEEANEVLSKYVICQACNGQGIVKSVYNHMVMEKTCEACDGESIVLKELINRETEALK